MTPRRFSAALAPPRGRRLSKFSARPEPAFAPIGARPGRLDIKTHGEPAPSKPPIRSMSDPRGRPVSNFSARLAPAFAPIGARAHSLDFFNAARRRLSTGRPLSARRPPNHQGP